MPLYLGSKTVSENINMGDIVIQNTFDLFDVKWSDHIINNESWMCADDFNWIDGSVFSAAWNELKSEWDLATIDSTPAQQDVIGDITINYWKSPKGYKLVEYGGDTPETNENLLQQLYDEVGIAWYYLIDTTGQIRFKLPRTKYGFVGVRSGTGNFVDESLPNIKGQYESIQLNADGVSGAFYAGSNIRYKPTHTDLSTGMGLGLDASRSSSTYQDGANVQQKSTEMHLYFYLADFVRTPLESNLNTFITETKEALNEKVNVSDYSADKTLIENDINTLETTKITQTDLDNTINTQRTNCITKIPQDIKLELNDGVLTLKAGSKVYVPNGPGIFEEIVKQSDEVVNIASVDGKLFAYLNSDKYATSYTITQFSSGTTAPSSGFSIWFDTNGGKIKRYQGSTFQDEGSSLPFAIITVTDGKVTSIDQVFNGFGYIGSTIFALPGVEGLIPVGKNTDGGINNKKQISVMSVKTFSGAITNGIFAIDGNGTLQTGNTLVYDNDKNLNYLNGTTLAYWCNCGAFSTDSIGRITSLSPKTTFQAADFQGIPKLVGDNMFSGVNTFESGNTFTVKSRICDFVNNIGDNYSFMRFSDINNKQAAFIGGVKLSNGNWGVYIQCNAIDGKGSYGTIGVYTNDSGAVLTYAPTPPASDNSTQIATTAWVKGRHQVVSVLPANPDPNTFYYIPEE